MPTTLPTLEHNHTDILSSPTPRLLTIKEAAKRIGTPRYELRDIVEHPDWTPHLPVLASIRTQGKTYVSTEDLDAWVASLNDRQRLSVLPCTRKGCASQIDGWPHREPFLDQGGTITPDGRPRHGISLDDSRPRMPGSTVLRICATGEPEPDTWDVHLEAIGDEPWEVGVTLWADTFPLKEDDCYVKARYEVPNADRLANAIVQAVAKRDKLNAEGGQATTARR